MTSFRPIPAFEDMPTVVDLDRLEMSGRALQADFSFARDDPRRLRVSFSVVAVVRALDDTHWSTEQDEPCEGMINGHFAYEVEGARFWKAQSPLINDQRDAHPLTHYAFVTGWTCLDVISDQGPVFTIMLP